MSSLRRFGPGQTTPPPHSFGALLRHHRVLAGLTQEALAERARLSGRAVSDLERGVNRSPQPGTLERLSDALQLSPAELVQLRAAARLEKLERRLVPLPLQSAGAPAGLTPAGASPAIKRSLPIPPTPLVGRELEVQAVCALLQRPEVRLLTLLGTAGVGKTRLALEVAAEVGEAFAEGARFISLAALSDPGLVLPTIAEALELHGAGSWSILTLLTTVLHAEQVLLVLDNFEQVIAAAAQLATLLETCPRIKLLVTSREALHLRAEQQFQVPPLALPPLLKYTARQALDVDALSRHASVQLFIQRAQAAQSGFQLTPGNAATINEICQRLDGLPLAIELAAPRLKLISLQVLLSRLKGRLQVLMGGARDLPERQRTMWDTMAWSYELLTSAEQALFRRLAVFVNGWALSAAEQVCPAAGALELDLLEGLSSLMDKSLLRQEQGSDGEVRYRLMYVLREFGLECLEEAGEGAATREAHAVYYLALAEEAWHHLDGAEQKEWRDRLEQEHGNLRAALTWWLEQAERSGGSEAAERALRLYWALAQFWVDQSYWSEAHVYLERVLALRVGVAEAVQVPVLLDAAERLSEVDYQVERAEVLIQEALDLARLAGDLPGTTFALLVRGFVAVHQDQYALAQAAFEEGAACARQGADAFMRGICLKNVVDVLLLQGDYEQARKLAEEVLAIFRGLDSPRQMGEALARLGWTHFVAQGDQALATSLVEQGLAQVQEMGHVATTRWALFLLGVLRAHHGQFTEARTLLEESLTSGTGQVAPRDRFQGQTRLVRLLVQQGELAEAQALSQENRTLLPASGGNWLVVEYLEGRRR